VSNSGGAGAGGSAAGSGAGALGGGPSIRDAASNAEASADSGAGGAVDAGRDAAGGTASTDAQARADASNVVPGTSTFGQDTHGGSGGTVIKVTTLAASGAGSLAQALATAGPRIVVFEVGGVIDLNRGRLQVTQPFLTIAGQTAPPPGITVIRGGMTVSTHDVVVQHVRFRMGDAGAAPASGFEPDVTTDGPSAYNVVFDHCSVAWGVDENLSVSGPRFDGVQGTSRRVTISNNIIAEGLYDSIHSKGIHSMGSLIHDYCTEVAVVGNFYAHNNERNPWFKAFGTGVVVNNVIYNPGTWAIRLGAVPSEWVDSGIVPQPPDVTVVGNYMKYGTNTPAGLPLVGSNSSGRAFVEDNVAVSAAGAATTIVGTDITMLATRPSWPVGLVARPSGQVVDWVLAHAGARPKERDDVDNRLVAGFRNGTGAFVNSQNDVGGYPAPAPTQRTLTVPADVDAWLRQLASDLE
jgi:hypothetical protein